MYIDDRKVNKKMLLEQLPISPATAARYLQADKMPDAMWELLCLKVRGQIIPKSWRGFRFCHEEKLWSEADYSFSAQSLEQINFIFNESHFLKRDNDELREYVQYLEVVKPRATVTRIEAKNPRESLTTGKQNNRLFHKTD